MRKNLGIALDEARRSGAQLPVTVLVDQLYAEVEALGGRRWDTSSLIARLRAAHPPRRAPCRHGRKTRVAASGAVRLRPGAGSSRAGAG